MSINEGLSIKRLTKEFSNMQEKPSYQYYAEPVKGEMFEWHFTIRGPVSTDYEGGIYHGVIMFPETYPFKPPSVQFLTPNGRFEVNTKICLTFTNFHPEYWQPAWTVRTILIGLQSYMPVEEESLSIGSIVSSSAERKRLAKASCLWKCNTCGCIREFISDKMTEENKKNDEAEVKQKLPEFKVTAKPKEEAKTETITDSNVPPTEVVNEESKDKLIDMEELKKMSFDNPKQPINNPNQSSDSESDDNEEEKKLDTKEIDKRDRPKDKRKHRPIEYENSDDERIRIERETKEKEELKSLIMAKRDKNQKSFFILCMVAFICWNIALVIDMIDPTIIPTLLKTLV